MLNFEQTIYVQIEKDCFALLHAQSGNKSTSYGKFSNSRLAIAHFQIAEESLKMGILDVYPKSFFRVKPVVVMHQIYNSEGGLCEIEKRILKEVAFGAGARKVFLWQGHNLSTAQLINRIYKKA